MSRQPEVLSDDEEGDFKNDFKNTRAKGRDNDFDDFDDDEFTASTANAPQPAAGGAEGFGDSQAVANRPYDEAVELDEDEDSHPSPQGAAHRPHAEGTGRAGGMREGAAGGAQQGEAEEGLVKNKPFDEAMELSSEESVDDVPEPQTKKAPADRKGDPPPRAAAAQEAEASYGDEDEQEPRFGGTDGNGRGRGGGDNRHAQQQKQQQQQQQQEDDEEEEDEEDEGDNAGAHREVNAADAADGGEVAAGMYNPADYADLNVSAEIKELFQYIGRYKPHNIELETKMKPFIPDYIPAVGEIDPFVKVPRPDAQPDTLGLTVLDEPTSQQSDPVVMQLQLRAITKASSHQPVLVRSVEAAEKDPKAVKGWIDSIRELHRNKPQPSVTYSKPMPDVEELMQIWPSEFEDLLDQVRLPGADIEMSLREYAKLVCSLLDIPVHGSVIEPLHLLFTLFSDFKANVHFQQQFTAAPALGGAPQQLEGDRPKVTGHGESLSFD